MPRSKHPKKCNGKRESEDYFTVPFSLLV
uniref:Uncharacterized protein n=1 Tax=Arundo donax TaxID=35708 RepID=A0A0A8ZQQ7_ARUDO